MIFLCYHGVTSTKSVNVENYSKNILIKKIYKTNEIFKRNYKMISIEDIYYHIKNKIPFSKKMLLFPLMMGLKITLL